MRRVYHDRLAKFATDLSGRCLRRIGGAKHFADFANGIDALVAKGDALLGAGLVALAS